MIIKRQSFMTPETEQQYKNQIAALQAEIEKLKNQQTKAIQREKYGLNWIDVPEEFDEKSKNSIPVLIEDKGKAIKNADGKPTHILIEGDNYHALTCLNYTHAGKIDVIYIDPPYNTGSDGFTYKDARFMTEFPNGKTVPKDDPLRHSTWLSFMEKRLRLAKNLLSDKGVIFISIDDNEQANLKLLCDQIFGEKNFIGTLPTIMNLKGNQDEFGFAGTHEYTLVYCNNINFAKIGVFLLSESDEEYHEWECDEIGFYKKGANLKSTGVNAPREKRPNLFFPIYVCPDGTFSIDEKIQNSVEIYPITDKKEVSWRWSKEKFKKEAFNVIISFEEGKISIYKKQRPSIGDIPSKKPKSIFYKPDYSSGNGTTQLKDIFNGKIFNNPKPIELIKDFILLSSSSSSTILDFFAGSGTTLHATMKLNAEDGGNRQCILVQQQENDSNICESITYERNRRVMQGYTNAKGEEISGLGNSLKYYKTDFIGENDAEKAGDEDKITLAQKAGYLISLVENTLEEIETNDFYQIFSDAEENQFTAIYFNGDTEKFPDFVQSIQEKNKKTTVYIFTWGSPDIFENEFDDLTNITIKSIPQPILEIYKSLMKNEE